MDQVNTDLQKIIKIVDSNERFVLLCLVLSYPTLFSFHTNPGYLLHSKAGVLQELRKGWKGQGSLSFNHLVFYI